MSASNTIEIILKGVDNATEVMTNVSDYLESTGQRITSIGAGLTALTAPLAIGLGAATQQALAFDEAMTNIQAVTQQSTEQIAAMSDEVLGLGANSRFGPQAVADAMYDVVGGVADATSHMAILEASIHTAQAGNAALGSTTSALISIMNSYTYSADQASFASDVLTQTVAKGVGTMDEFAAALPLVAGLASSAGIEFDDLAGSLAFMTTKGYSASQSATRLQSVITALLNPNERMKEALAAVGIESGSMALETYGLAGTLNLLEQALGGSQDAMAAALGSTEALQAAVALGDDSFASFFDTFVSGIDGATAAAEGIQMTSPAAQLDLLRSKLSAVAVEIGETMLPRINDLVDAVSPAIDRVMEWIDTNPELASTITAVAAAATIAGPALIVVGQALSGISTIVRVASVALGALLSPVGLLIAGGTALASILGVDVLGGIGAFVDQVTRVLPGRIENFGGDIGRALESMFNIDEDGSSFFSTLLEGFGMSREQAQQWGANIHDTLNSVVEFIQTQAFPGVQRFFDFLSQVWEQVRPALEAVGNWFINDALPAVVNFVETRVIPAVQGFFDFLSQVWDQVRPALESLVEWFIADGLPSAVDFVEQSIMPGIQNFINLIEGIWEAVRPALEELADWFITDGLPMVQNFIDDTIHNFIEPLIDIIAGIWQAVQPALQDVFDWFVDDGLPGIGEAIDAILEDFIRPLIDTLAGIWDTVSEALGELLRWFSENGVPVIQSAITTLSDNFIQPLLNTLSGFWESVRPGLEAFQAGVESVFNWLKDNVIQPFINIINGIRDAIDAIFGKGGAAEAAENYVNRSWGTGNVFPEGVAGKPAAAKGMFDLGTGTPFGTAGTAFAADPQVYIPRTATQFSADSGGQQINWSGDFVVNGERLSEISDDEKVELVVMALELLRGG